MTQVDDTGKKVPDVSSSEIGANAWMIWELIRTTQEYKHGKSRNHDGQPGREWTGSVNKIIDTLWPSLTDRYLVNREVTNEIKVALNRYLRLSGNLVCVHNGGVKARSVWWVSDHWSSLDVRQLRSLSDASVVDDPAVSESSATPSEPEVSASDVFDVPVPEPTQLASEASTAPLGAVTEEEAMNEDDHGDDDSAPDEESDGLELKCRHQGCAHISRGYQGRAAHERSAHGIRVNRDGTVTTFDPSKLNRRVTVGEVKRLIVDVCRDAGEPLTIGDIEQRCMTTDPTVTKAAVRDGIDKLLAAPFNGFRLTKVVSRVTEGRGASFRRFTLERVTPTPSEVAAAVSKPSTLVSRVFQQVTGQKTQETGDVNPRTTDLPDVERHAANLRALLGDLDRITRLQADLEELRQGLAASSAKNHELVDRLRQVTAERDELQNKLDTLKSVFGTALS